MKQTAVEWLVQQLRQLAYNPKTHLGLGDVRVTQGYIDEVEEQAKQMEKQEIKDAFHDGRTWNNSWNEETYFVEVYEKNGRYL